MLTLTYFKSLMIFFLCYSIWNFCIFSSFGFCSVKRSIAYFFSKWNESSYCIFCFNFFKCFTLLFILFYI